MVVPQAQAQPLSYTPRIPRNGSTDVGLPTLDGFQILATLRGQGNPIAVIMLTARDSAVDTLHGLEGGADDYMSKLFRFDELLARVRLRLKAGQPGPVGALQVGGLELDLLTRRISVDGAWHDLSAREFALAEEFIRPPRPSAQS